MVAIGGGGFLSLLSRGVPGIWAWQIIVCDSDRPGGTRSVRAYSVRAWQRGLGGIFVSRRNGRHRVGMPNRADRLANAIVESRAVDCGRLRNSHRDRQPDFFLAGLSRLAGPHWPEHDSSWSWNLHVHCGDGTDAMEESALAGA